MPVVKTITYENLEEEHKKNPKILPFKYLKPFKQEIEEIEEEKAKGIMSTPEAKQVAQMSNKGLREFYGGYLVPYGYKEWEIMTMPMKELEYLFNTVMHI